MEGGGGVRRGQAVSRKQAAGGRQQEANSTPAGAEPRRGSMQQCQQCQQAMQARAGPQKSTPRCTLTLWANTRRQPRRRPCRKERSSGKVLRAEVSLSRLPKPAIVISPCPQASPAKSSASSTPPLTVGPSGMPASTAAAAAAAPPGIAGSTRAAVPALHAKGWGAVEVCGCTGQGCCCSMPKIRMQGATLNAAMPGQ